MKINEGQIVLKVDGVINLEEIKSNLSLNLEKYKNIIWTKETRKDVQELISELKPERTKIKKIAAAFNKSGKEIIRTKYEEIKEVEALLDEVINPLEQGEKDYLEKVRLENIEKKKAIFQDQISEINEVINQLNNEFNYELHQEVVFIDDWGKKSENSIKEEFEKIVDQVGETRCKLLDKIKGVENTCKLLKLQYDLQSELDYKIILGDDIYIKDLSDLEKKLDKFADNQQIVELAAAERAEEEVKRKAKIEAEYERRIQAEIEETERQTRLKIKKEAEEKEILEKELAEKEKLEKEKIAKLEIKKPGSVKTREYNLKFTVNVDQAKKLFECLNENNIKFEYINA